MRWRVPLLVLAVVSFVFASVGFATVWKFSLIPLGLALLTAAMIF